MAEPGEPVPLSDGLLLRTARDACDLERAAAFNGVIHGEGVAAMSRALFLHHPAMEPQDVWFVEDARSGEVVSSLCLIPWTWRYQDVTLRAGELGIVGTLEPYRRRGLVRAQVAAFRQRLRARRCHLSHIQGIPYFYRQFGYEYALPLESEHRLELHQVPDAPAGERYTFRTAALGDLQALRRFYLEAARFLALHTVRDEPVWHYLFQHSPGTETEAETWMVEERAGAPVGYLRVSKHGFGAGLIVSEASHLPPAAARAALRQARQWAVERGRPFIRLNLPAGSALAVVARGLGAVDRGHYAWQIHLPDRVGLLRRIAPLLESRVAASAFAGLTLDIALGLYEETLLLRVRDGCLEIPAAPGEGVQTGARIHLPPPLLAPLALGYRTFEELSANYHDASADPLGRALAEVLFPKVPSFLYTVY